MRIYTRLLAIIIALSVVFPGVASDNVPIHVGEKILDNHGKHINAHGGNILCVDSTYYWYGEHRGDGAEGSYQKGVSCYTSTNLRDWIDQGIVLSVVDDEKSPIQKGCIIERPKVVFCPQTGKYVMWFHNELKGNGYDAAMAGVATADSPLGPFVFKYSGRINPGRMPMNLHADTISETYTDTLRWWTPEWFDAIRDGMFTRRDLPGGQMSRDMTIFIDPADGKGYHIYSSEENLTLHIAELDSTYEKHTGKYIRILPGGHNEAPAVFKHNGKYWMITSGCTGWAPNEARLLCADSMMGEWELLPNPCRGNKAEITFGGQSSYVMPIDGKLIFMADIWHPEDLSDSRYIWLPIIFDNNDVPYISMQ